MCIHRRAFNELQPIQMQPKPKYEWIQSRNEEPSTGSKMSSMRKYTYDELTGFPVLSMLPMQQETPLGILSRLETRHRFILADPFPFQASNRLPVY